MMTAAGGEALNVEDVFSTYLYEGTNTTNTINNGIDLDGESGIVWIKNRDQTDNHYIFGGESGNNWTKILSPNGNGFYGGGTGIFDGVSSTGFTVKSDFGGVNTINEKYASWTFRKAPKFFDVVTYTGDSTFPRTINHNLGSVPGCIIIKSTTESRDWIVYHRGLDSTNPAGFHCVLNTTAAAVDSIGLFRDIEPTSTQFTVGGSVHVNRADQTYVAYLFAHHDGDGEFGPTGDQDIIKCGSYTGNGSTDGPEIDLGFEPQWLLVKSDGSANWVIIDSMRGIVSDGSDKIIMPNGSDIEYESSYLIGGNMANLLPTGFKITEDNATVNGNSNTYIYIAIRRGPMAVPEDATDVFALDTHTPDNSGTTSQLSGFVTDMVLTTQTEYSGNRLIFSRLTGGTKMLKPNASDSEATVSNQAFDTMDGFLSNIFWGNTSTPMWWHWKRAPSFFDTVCYTGNGTAGRTVSHNLGVAPEMMWVKSRDSTFNWVVYHKDIIPSGTTNQYYLKLNSNVARSNSESPWNSTDPAATQFTLGNWQEVNRSGDNFVAYLFATVAGVSKVGGYTGTGSSATIDCGFTSGARFVLIKNAEQSDDWYLFDTERGIVSGNDNFLQLNTSNAENPYNDWIDPHNSGFIVNSGLVNSGRDYVFYAIA